jgi:hypothetical protein
VILNWDSSHFLHEHVSTVCLPRQHQLVIMIGLTPYLRD